MEINKEEKSLDDENLETDSRTSVSTGNNPGLQETTIISHDSHLLPLLIFMVGLPARGKSYIARKLLNYLNWKNIETHLFNVGMIRRKLRSMCGSFGQNCRGSSLESIQQITKFSGDFQTSSIDPYANVKLIFGANEDSTESNASKKSYETHDFFDSNNEKFSDLRNELAVLALNECLLSIKNGGIVVIHDATNSNLARRKTLIERTRSFDPNIRILFLETICDDEDILSNNLRLKIGGPDYLNVAQSEAMADFLKRIENYEQIYRMLSPEECEYDNCGYIKIINTGREYDMYNIRHKTVLECIEFLTRLRISKKRAYLARCAQSLQYSMGKMDEEGPITEEGILYAEALGRTIKEQLTSNETCTNTQNNIEMWISSAQISRKTAQIVSKYIPQSKIRVFDFLDNLNIGIFRNQIHSGLKNSFLDELDRYKADPLNHKWTFGESVKDFMERVGEVILRLESTKSDVIIISHLANLNSILSYFQCKPMRTLELFSNEYLLRSVDLDNYTSKIQNCNKYIRNFSELRIVD